MPCASTCLEVGAGHGEPPRRRAGREHEPPVPEPVAVRERHRAGVAVDGGRLGAGTEVDALLGVPLRGLRGELLGVGLPTEVLLRQHGAKVRLARLAADERDRAVEPAFARRPDDAPFWLLAEPAARRLYEYVVASGEPVTRDRAVAATGIPRATAAYHLERMADAGLLTATSARVSGRSGPGAGRPARLYQPGCEEAAHAVPERRYRLADEVLCEAIEASRRTGRSIDASLHAVAETRGRELARESGGLDGMLTAAGYRPVAEPDGSVTLTNRPFARLDGRHPATICGGSVAMLEGAVDESGAPYAVTPVAPEAGRCCACLTPRERQGRERSTLSGRLRRGQPPGP